MTETPLGDSTLTRDLTREERHELCASLVLDSAQDGPAALGVFTDEELTALDGLDTPQVVPLPWIVDNEAAVSPRAAASVALRGLIARRLVIPAELLADDLEELGDDPRRLYAVDPVQGILTLRRGFVALITYQRMVSEQIMTVVQYAFEGEDNGTILEEEITPDGYHHFSALPVAVAVDHAMAVIDQDEVAADDGPVVSLRSSDVDEDESLSARIADTRALIVASLVTRGGDAEQVTYYATSDRLLVSRSDQDPATAASDEDPVLEFAEASSDSARELVAAMLTAAREARA
ncbi:hypothetical protein Bra3105_07665 [Brachybacterium halotolerans subsp. kimchii]|uniref:hypothetical protein n=1 Tax=Brachybacterium halotolerans TaxID=2795215 RepID=UPI001E304016|nr:hypothetical protein [Brachybacterium halotolerans]UEJ84170.1 hypothetical protein Bra3105_07665 [Brachybacterium halotolerans subsp. kimchii]